MPKQSEKTPVITRKQKLATTNDNNGAECLSTSISKQVEYLENPVKLETDKNEYRAIKLPNGLKALLVTHQNLSTNEEGSQEKSKSTNTFDRTSRGGRKKDLILKENIAPGKAVCTLTINVGSFSDPPDVPCISRISKNVVLTASKKYPLANSFKKFVSNCGGTLTSTDTHENTEFFFYVAESNFRDALDRFVNCFIEPVLRQDVIDNERRRIETEDLCNVQFSNFVNGKDYLLSKIASGYDQHPACNLGPNHVNNLRDQSDERVYKEVEKFVRRHYSANRMAVVIEGHVPLDTLEKYAKDYFSKIPNNELPPPDFTRFSYDRCFDIKEFRMIYQMKPSNSDIIQGDFHLELTWPMPSVQNFYRCKPQQYIAWIINHSGKGSLVKCLRKKNWCVGLDCGIGRSDLENNSVYSLFSIFISLTKEGYENQKQVLDLVYSYINRLRREGPQHRIFEEIQKIAVTTCRLELVPRFAVSCGSVCENMHLYMPRDYLTGSMLYLEYNPDAIKQCLSLLSPVKANVIVYDKNFPKCGSIGEEWEEENNDPVYYRRKTIAKDWIIYWDTVAPLPEFYLPQANVIVDDDFEIIPPPENLSDHPAKIYADEVSEIYYKVNTTYRTSTTYIHHCYCSPLPLISPENAVMVDIFGRILKHLCTDALYSAVDAGFSYDINGTEKGLLLQATVLSPREAHFMATIADITSNLWRQVTKKLFESMMKKQMKVYESTAFEPPDLADEVRLGLVRTVRWTSMDKLTACSKLNYVQFKDLAKHFTDHVFVKCLVQGNMRKSDVIVNVQECIHKLKCQPPIGNSTNYPTRTSIHKIPQGEHCYRFYSPRKDSYDKEITTVTNYYQFPAKSFRQTVLIELITQFMTQPEFNVFRARESLDPTAVRPGMDIYGKHGYSLCVNVMMILGSLDAPTVEAILERYRKSLYKVFKHMSDRDWNKARKAFIDLKKTPFANLEIEVSRNWMEIGAQAYVFHREAAELAALEGLTIKELREGMMNLTSSGSHIRKLTIQCVGLREAAQNSACTTQKANSQEGLKPLCGTARERVEKPSDYFITDINEFKKRLQTFPISGEITPRTDRN